MVSEGYCCIFSEEGCWQRGVFGPRTVDSGRFGIKDGV